MWFILGLFAMNSDMEVQKDSTKDNELITAGIQPSEGLESAKEETETGTETVSVKRCTVKLTHMALLDKIETLQKFRKHKLNKASALKSIIQELMEDTEYKAEVFHTFVKYKLMCKEAKEAHESLLNILLVTERDKHETWFKAKLLSVSDFIEDVTKWLKQCEIRKSAEVVNDDADEVKPGDTISNIESNISKTKSGRKSSTSSRSSRASSARIQEEAERAALEARTAALKEKHALEEQTEELRRRKEKLELDTEMAASDAKLAVLSAASRQATSNTQIDGMESYFVNEKETRQKQMSPTLNSMENTKHQNKMLDSKQLKQQWKLPSHKNTVQNSEVRVNPKTTNL